MKKTLLLTLAIGFYSSVNAQFFTQDFNSSTTVDDYVNATTPSASQFTYISPSVAAATNGSLTTSITAGNLRFDRPNPTTEGKTNNAPIYVYRNYGLSIPPTFVKFSFDFELSGTAATSLVGGSSLNIQLGNTFANTTGNYATRIGIFPSSAVSGEYKVTTIDNVGGAGAPSSAVLTGKTTITYIVNNSGADQTYSAPDNTIESIANGKMEFWVGTTRVTNDYPIKVTANAIDGFKFSAASSHKFFGILDFDNIQMTDLLGGTTLSTSKIKKSERKITASPNPTSGAFEINVPENLKNVKISIADAQGRMVSTKNYVVNNGKVSLDIADKANGVYFAKLNLPKPAFVKVIKK